MNLQISKRLSLSGKKVLLVDSNQSTPDVRNSVLRSHEVEVDVAEDLSAARVFWQPNVYD
jgi:CheY-like chemotaxis protein